MEIRIISRPDLETEGAAEETDPLPEETMPKYGRFLAGFRGNRRNYTDRCRFRRGLRGNRRGGPVGIWLTSARSNCRHRIGVETVPKQLRSFQQHRTPAPTMTL